MVDPTGFERAIAAHLALACKYASAGDMFQAGQQHALACERGWHVLGPTSERCNALLTAFCDVQLALGRTRGILPEYAGMR